MKRWFGLNVLLLGPAGSGKSSLAAEFGKFLMRQGADVGFINLDPACDYVPYAPDFDIRSVVSARSVMKRERLGPNAALLRSMRLMDKKRREITKKLAKKRYAINLVDTPGQMELFVFQDVADIVDAFEKPVVGVFLMPADYLKNYSDFITTRFLSIAAQLRLRIPVVNVVSKFDMVPPGSRKKINAVLKNPSLLKKRMVRGSDYGMREFLMKEIESLFAKSMKSSRMIKVSSKTKFGFEELYDAIGEALCECGDLS
ncbi:MAG: ATP/GTP-binding protein [Candidatus Aenigmatarchaeota archaeon]